MLLITAVTFCAILWADYSVLQKTICDNLIETVEDNEDEIEFFKHYDDNESDRNADQYISYGNGYLEIDDDFLDKVNGISTALYRDTGELLYGENFLAKETQKLSFSDRVIQEVSSGGITYYVFDCALTSPGTENLWLRGIVSEEQGTQQFSSIVKLSAVALPVLLILAVIGGYWIASRALRPVHKITEAASQINQGRDLKKRIGLGEGSDELHELANVFDDMFRRLDSAFQAEQQFTSDASHELRTPVSVIMAQCEYTLEKKRTAAEYEEALGVIQRQGGRMSRLIDDMLCFARMEHSSGYPKERLNFSMLAEDICEDMSLLKTQNIILTWEVAPDIWINGSRMLLSRLLANLISNAYRYGKRDGEIHVRLIGGDKENILTVGDNGIGIPSDIQEKIFERFYRADSSRSSEGTGLGLAMVRDIAAYHGGSVEVSSEVGKGSVFSVRFPS